MKVTYIMLCCTETRNNMNMSIQTATIKFIKDTGRFDPPL